MKEAEVDLVIKVRVRVDARIPETGVMRDIQIEHKNRAAEKLMTTLRTSQGFEVIEGPTCHAVTVPVL